MLAVDLHSLIETHDHPFVAIDGDYHIVAANQAYCRQYGLAREDILHRRCHEISHHSPRPCHENGELCPHLALFAGGESSEVLHTHYDNAGHACRSRIKGMALRGAEGQLYLGEMVFPLEADLPLGCEEMRMVGHSPAFLACIDHLARAAESEASVLLVGESGVGKELAARFLHERSGRAGRPFIAINCAAVPEAMFADELFGHERGAFTGSTAQKKGLYELADGGTLFLDEISEIPPARQAKLLRVLETGEFRRVGGTATLRADVRLVSASNRNLLDWVDRGLFREDLYYRIAGIDVALPPLRERSEDIQALAEVLLARLGGPDRPPCRLDKAAAQRLKGYPFPGNVRELRNVLQRAMLLSRSGVIGADAIVFQPSPAQAPVERVVQADPGLKGMEREHIRDLLALHQGHRRTVADLLGVSERTLYRKLGRLGLK
ncbi:MAG: sigma 54-interacting transcriptional regulator [Betaproteobacteria bacterium]|nr:sigma 54-interacting transcriptional regulator [Betaproteobacteria bacterium]